MKLFDPAIFDDKIFNEHGGPVPVIEQGGGDRSFWLRRRRQKAFDRAQAIEARAVSDQAAIEEVAQEKKPDPILPRVGRWLSEIGKIAPRRPQIVRPESAHGGEDSVGHPRTLHTVRPAGVKEEGKIGRPRVLLFVRAAGGTSSQDQVGIPTLWGPPQRAVVLMQVSDAKPEELHRGARIYSAGTARGFERMRNKGIPRVALKIEDRVARSVAVQYLEMFRGLVGFLGEIAGRYGFRMKDSPEGQLMVSDSDPYSIMEELRGLMGRRGPDVQKLRLDLNAQLSRAEQGLLSDLFGDAADSPLATALKELALPKREVFASRIEGLRSLYLDSAIDRIQGEQDDLKASFLGKLIDWVEGRTETLNVSKLVREMKETSVRRARYFARDQFSRFNKAMTVTTYQQADAPYIEVLTVGDERVRPTHKDWNRKIYSPSGLMNDPRYEDYNCRCGFVPHWGLTSEMERRFVA